MKARPDCQSTARISYLALAADEFHHTFSAKAGIRGGTGTLLA